MFPLQLTILGAHMVNNPQTSDVTFVVEGRPFHAHRVQLLNSSEIFKVGGGKGAGGETPGHEGGAV